MDSVGNAILTGFNGPLCSMPVDMTFVDMFPGGVSVLDFGCGIGRYSRQLARKYQQVVGYDNSNMISMTPTENRLPNIRYSNDWSNIKNQVFTDCCASLCFQHIHKPELVAYIDSLKAMITRNLIIHSRTWLDYNGGDVLPVICNSFRLTHLKFTEDGSHFYGSFTK